MNVFLNSQLIIDYPTDQVWDWVNRNFRLKNPEYIKKLKMGFWVGNTPEYIKLYSWDKRNYRLTLPFGTWRSFFKKFSGQFSVYSEIKPIEEKIDYHSNIKLYDYQEKISRNILKYKNGIVVAPCGSGKTKSALESVARIGGKTLWLTHTRDLMNQAKRNAEECFNLPKEAFGTITNGKANPGTVITFATVQTLSKMDLEQFRDMFDVIVTDECHHTSGTPSRVTMFYKVLSHLNARYKIGLTATPFRADGMERSMYAILGEVIGEITRADIADRTCPLHIEAYDTYWAPDDQGEAFKEEGRIDYAKLIDDLTHDPDRLKLISDKINALKGPTLVLANRIEYLEQLQERYPKKSLCLSGMTPTKANKKKRDEALLQLDNGELDCVFSTFQLAKEGLDVPNLRYVVFATPEKDETTLIQSVGRVQRTAESKKYGTVIDFCDNGFGLYAKWFDFRCSLYDHLFHADIQYFPADDYRTFL